MVSVTLLLVASVTARNAAGASAGLHAPAGSVSVPGGVSHVPTRERPASRRIRCATVTRMSHDVAVSRDIAAPADDVYALVADLPRMGEWSNENTGGKWVRGATRAEPGAKFRGSNRNGWHRWNTQVTVTEAIPGERLSFDVDLVGLPISHWTYEIEPSDGGGCRVTESWTDRRPGWFRPLARIATGVDDRARHTLAGMADTLERIATAAEATH